MSSKFQLEDVVTSNNQYHSGIKFRIIEVIETARGYKYNTLRLTDTKKMYGFDNMYNEFSENEIRLD